MTFLRLLARVTTGNRLYVTVPIIAENEEDDTSEMTHISSQSEGSSGTWTNI